MLKTKYQATFWTANITGFGSNKIVNVDDERIEKKMCVFLNHLILCWLSGVKDTNISGAMTVKLTANSLTVEWKTYSNI